MLAAATAEEIHPEYALTWMRYHRVFRVSPVSHRVGNPLATVSLPDLIPNLLDNTRSFHSGNKGQGDFVEAGPVINIDEINADISRRTKASFGLERF